jgi:hypothetical protein
MRNANQTSLDSGIYTRLRDVQMSEADRQDAVKALRQAEQIAEMFLWVRERVAEFGQSFLKPSLKH